ncbi:hypothetical protein EB796_015080 [Bugula neritina]|uniref:CLPB n=1 Tax=Bugula neritina TaxID=10212 RepID=A0A7J7JLV8_BUGNE|nr:hypothetical protein EB796_015080 [Bugula neritina]
MGHHSLISLLYQYGVDGSLENGKGYTAAELGTDKSKAQILALEAERKKKRNSEVFRNVNLKEVLTTELVGQRLAIEQVSSVVNRLEMGWTNCKHPMVLLFVGATGLGKTEMAKRLAQYLRGNSKTSFVHVNLSEYQTEHEAAKFIGSPPGYVGYSESGDGQLISLLAKNPKAVVLFDEADKAHPNVLTTLLQLFDEGRLTSGSGKSIDCPEAVFVLTANLAIDQIKDFGDGLRKFFSPQSIESGNNNRMQDYVHYFKSRLLHGPLKKAFKRDELLGRINELAIFLPFSKAEQRKLIETQLCQVRSLAAKNHGITLTWDSSLYDFLLKTFNQSYGARHMRHEIDRKVVNRLSTAFDEGLCRPGEFLHLELHPDLGDDSIKHMKDQRIRLCRISPLNTKEYLDIRFADFEELFRLEAS